MSFRRTRCVRLPPRLVNDRRLRGSGNGDKTLRPAADRVEPLEVLLHGGIATKGGQHFVQDHLRARTLRMVDAVVHPLPFAAGIDDARIAQIRQMPGYLRLALLQDLHEVADTDFPAVHEIQQAQTGWVRQRREQPWKIERARFLHSLNIRLDRYVSGPYIRLSRYVGGVGMDTRSAVKEKYGSVARNVREGGMTACCAPDSGGCDPISSDLYDAADLHAVPEKALLASLGCGNPTALIELKPGQTVLDLGSGGGIDVLLSARRVGPSGKAYGLDMTDEMLALARDNQRQAGVGNAEFLRGEIEDIPLPSNSVDVIISNCVINLSSNKDRVLAEAFRVLRPGGRFAVSDVVVRGQVPDAVRESMLLWVGCIAGALEESEYKGKLLAAGFVNVELEPTRVYKLEDARQFLTGAGIDVDEIAPDIQGRLISAFVRATKPGAGESKQP